MGGMRLWRRAAPPPAPPASRPLVEQLILAYYNGDFEADGHFVFVQVLSGARDPRSCAPGKGHIKRILFPQRLVRESHENRPHPRRGRCGSPMKIDRIPAAAVAEVSSNGPDLAVGAARANR